MGQFSFGADVRALSRLTFLSAYTYCRLRKGISDVNDPIRMHCFFSISMMNQHQRRRRQNSAITSWDCLRPLPTASAEHVADMLRNSTRGLCKLITSVLVLLLSDRQMSKKNSPQHPRVTKAIVVSEHHHDHIVRGISHYPRAYDVLIRGDYGEQLMQRSGMRTTNTPSRLQHEKD